MRDCFIHVRPVKPFFLTDGGGGGICERRRVLERRETSSRSFSLQRIPEDESGSDSDGTGAVEKLTWLRSSTETNQFCWEGYISEHYEFHIVNVLL